MSSPSSARRFDALVVRKSPGIQESKRVQPETATTASHRLNLQVVSMRWVGKDTGIGIITPTANAQYVGRRNEDTHIIFSMQKLRTPSKNEAMPTNFLICERIIVQIQNFKPTRFIPICAHTGLCDCTMRW
jgi:hypothetical protein